MTFVDGGKNVTTWREDISAALREYVESKSYSYEKIAALINERFGTTYKRNALIGRAGRMGLSNPHKTKETKKRVRHSKNKASGHIVFRIVASNGNSNSMRVVQTVVADRAALRCIEVVPLNISFMELTDKTCKYAYGESDFVFCGHPTAEKEIDGKTTTLPYCGHHAAICYLPPKPRQDRGYVGRKSA